MTCPSPMRQCPLMDDARGGIGMRMAGAALGLAVINLLGIVQGLTIVGDQHQGRCPGIGGGAGPWASRSLAAVGRGVAISTISSTVSSRSRRITSSEGAAQRRWHASDSEVIQVVAIEQESHQQTGTIFGAVALELQMVLEDGRDTLSDLLGRTVY